jgi:glycosyltransferase involved in cell wall biosynthesis
MHTSRVSILLPCFNGQPFLRECIESLLKQTHSNWQAIVLDSYSTDGSWQFLRSVASGDSRFQLYQIPRDGLYAALNRGIQLATGEFLHIATADDKIRPEFLETLLDLLGACPEAGIAACDVRLINRDGGDLTAKDMAGYLPAETIADILSLGTVRCASPLGSRQRHANYRPPPHDCLLHYSAKSVYFSLNQLMIRTQLAKAMKPFDTTVGSIGDIDWLLRLNSLTGTVHLPQKLAMWRFHGRQLSVRQDREQLPLLKAMLERELSNIYERYRPLLSRNDCATLMLPIKCYLATTRPKRVLCWLEATFRILFMSIQRPVATLQAINACRLLPHKVKRLLFPMFLLRIQLFPRALDSLAPGSLPREVSSQPEGSRGPDFHRSFED